MAFDFSTEVKRAVVRRLVYVLIAAALAWFGMGEARAQTGEMGTCNVPTAQTTCTRPEAYAQCAAVGPTRITTYLIEWRCRVSGTRYFLDMRHRTSGWQSGSAPFVWAFLHDCPVDQPWNDATKTCDAPPCQNKPPLAGGWVPGDWQTDTSMPTSVCVDGCAYDQPFGSRLVKFVDGQYWTSTAGFTSAERTCSVGDGSPTSPPPADADGDGHSDGNDNAPNNPGEGNGQGQDGSQGDGTTGSGPDGGQGNGPGEGSGNGNTAGGGGSCDVAPSGTGDALLAMIAYQTWATRCAVERGNGEGNGDGGNDPKDNSAVNFNDGEEAEDSDADPGILPSHSFDIPAMLDMSGFLGGGGSCPDFGSITLGPFGTHSLGGQYFCDWLPVFRALIILMATGTAIKILLGYNA